MFPSPEELLGASGFSGNHFAPSSPKKYGLSGAGGHNEIRILAQGFTTYANPHSSPSLPIPFPDTPVFLPMPPTHTATIHLPSPGMAVLTKWPQMAC